MSIDVKVMFHASWPSLHRRFLIADDPDRRIVVVCNEDYGSSCAAHTLQRLGLTRAADHIGGLQAWAALRKQPD